MTRRDVIQVVLVNRFFFPDHSATSQLLSDLAFHLSGTNWPVSVITSRQCYDRPDAPLSALESVHGVTVHRVWTTRFGRGNLLGRGLDYLTFYWSAAWRLGRLVTSGDVIIAKTDPPLLSVVAALLAMLRGARLINWSQDLFPEVALSVGMRAARGWPGRILQRCRDWSLLRAEANVVVGRRAAAYLAARGIQQKKIVFVPNWADGVAIVPTNRLDNVLRTEWGLQERFVVAYSGNMGRAHEFDTILHAAELLRRDLRIVFLFAGGGRWKPWIESEAKRRGLDNVIFKPYQPRERLALSLGAADAHLVSLRPEVEGFVVPSKFYGVAAVGRPTLFVGDPDGEIARAVREFDCGRAVSQGDASGLAAAILELAENPELARQLGQRAREAFEEHWDKRIACKKWSVLLDAVAHQGREGGR